MQKNRESEKSTIFLRCFICRLTTYISVIWLSVGGGGNFEYIQNRTKKSLLKLGYLYISY